MKLEPDRGTVTMTQSTVTFGVNRLSRRKTDSTYMLFPLTEERARDLARQYNQLDTYTFFNTAITNRRRATTPRPGSSPG